MEILGQNAVAGLTKDPCTGKRLPWFGEPQVHPNNRFHTIRQGQPFC